MISVRIDPINAKADTPKLSATVKPAEIRAEAKAEKMIISVGAADVGVAVQPAIRTEYIGADQYGGEYTVMPSTQEKTLNTRGKVLAADVVVLPIPSNYGLITRVGASLTIS